MADPHLDTAAQRAATGMNTNARNLILQVFDQIADRSIGQRFFQDRFADFQDYCNAVSEVWGEDVGGRLISRLMGARDSAEFDRRGTGFDAMHRTMLQFMPEPDFRVAITESFRASRYMDLAQAERISTICRTRGIPWRFDRSDGFVWVGDEQVERLAIIPAVSALNDERFAGGVRTEFESARQELADGTPQALSKCVQQAGACVESAMKVVLTERQIPFDPQRDTATPLFDHLKTAGVVDEYMRSIVLGTMTPRNRSGGHGAGADPHQVPVEVAEAVLAAAAVSIAYLVKLLPER